MVRQFKKQKQNRMPKDLYLAGNDPILEMQMLPGLCNCQVEKLR